MKDYKFRAWDKQLKQFRYFDFSTCLPCYSYKVNWVVQQFTGLVDKNGREVYEGDIMKSDFFVNSEIKSIIFWEDGGFELDGDVISQDTLNYYEIVGNVFQNPELIV